MESTLTLERVSCQTKSPTKRSQSHKAGPKNILQRIGIPDIFPRIDLDVHGVNRITYPYHSIKL
ncbi:hypothetical protein DSO57_1014013 [Entomophthora muscae]|uniref:Uncharacterized protein n=1 Tax=Entomophthora muscae TaxID=34485 RepID=A0ACC2SIN3_9FUNG|nr:hypothetical protein DSO57_1014013 [Entomophthora muscae]